MNRFTFTKKNLVKILKGAAIAAAGAAALFLLTVLETLQINDPMLASFVVWFVPTATNAIKEFLRD